MAFSAPLKLTLSVAALLGLQACSTQNPHVPASLYQGTVLDQTDLSAKARTEIIEVNLDLRDSQLRRSEVMKVKAFIEAYKSNGHGPLSLSIPNDHPNEQLVVSAAAEIRDLGWLSGLEYEQFNGSAYNSNGAANAPILMAFKRYDAVMPECPTVASVNLADGTSNNDAPSLGCAVRANMAAMIADPADLMGQRSLDPSDPTRRSAQLSKWRDGQPSGAERSDDETGTISDAVE